MANVNAQVSCYFYTFFQKVVGFEICTENFKNKYLPSDIDCMYILLFCFFIICMLYSEDSFMNSKTTKTVTKKKT